MCKSPLHKIPWSHVVTLLDKLDDGAQRLWCAEKSLEHGWSRSVLMMQIETVAHARAGSAVTNFADRQGPRLRRSPQGHAQGHRRAHRRDCDLRRDGQATSERNT
ncbi:DUF1016 N-terminal domain-containing protein [Paraburkholderia sp. BR10923]|uniref:DUF1016 N-terminal domain-containing protein n=1 Tax=Paraburkholderia sp. BR10923 TaxID=3236992 RepID=UPI0034CF11E2